MHGFVFWESGNDLGKIETELKIVAEPLPIGDRARGFGKDCVVLNPQSHPMIADDTFPATVHLFPTKGLTGAERGVEVVILNGKGGAAQLHAMNKSGRARQINLKIFQNALLQLATFARM